MKRMVLLNREGDAPGMNAAIRSVVQVGIDKVWQLFGFRHGFSGLITNNVMPLGTLDVSGIIQQGGIILGSARCPEFKTENGRLGFDLRVKTLEHVQRGGAPSAYDRLLATRLGAGEVEHLTRGEHGVLVGLVKDEISSTPLAGVVSNKKPLDLTLREPAKMLAR